MTPRSSECSPNVLISSRRVLLSAFDNRHKQQQKTSNNRSTLHDHYLPLLTNALHSNRQTSNEEVSQLSLISANCSNVVVAVAGSASYWHRVLITMSLRIFPPTAIISHLGSISYDLFSRFVSSLYGSRTSTFICLPLYTPALDAVKPPIVAMLPTTCFLTTLPVLIFWHWGSMRINICHISSIIIGTDRVSA